MPLGDYDGQGNMIRRPDTANFDAWVRRWPHASRFFVFLNPDTSSPNDSLLHSKVRQWASFWADHLRSLGYQPDQLSILLLDEPYNADPARTQVEDRVITAWGQAIRAANTGIRIWENPGIPAVAARETMESIDTLSPYLGQFWVGGPSYRDFFFQWRSRNPRRSLALYSVPWSVRVRDPYIAFRLSAWSAWHFDAAETHFWSFVDTGGASSWDEYSSLYGHFSPLFIDGMSVTASKHLAAMREGVEDYEYLSMLRERVQQLERQGFSSPSLAQARLLLSKAGEEVLRSALGARASMPLHVDPLARWTMPTDHGAADRVRLDVLRSLEGLW
jgi:hypothetical protein